MNKTSVAALIISTANLAATLLIAKALLEAKRDVDANVEELRAKTNKTLGHIRTALADIEV
jgi:hypothetical protein